MPRASPLPRTRRRRVLLLAVSLLAQPAWGGPDTDADLQPEISHLVAASAKPPQTLRVVTFNVHYGRELSRLTDAILAHPALRTADLFLLQEIESYPAEGASRAHKLAQALQLNYVYAPARRTPAGGTHGLAILSRFPLSEVEVLPLKRYDLGKKTRRRIALAATLDLGGRPLRVYNLHLDTRINTGERLEQLRPVVEAALAQPVAQVVIGGDFNTNSFRWLFHRFPVFRSNQAGAMDEWMAKNGFETPLAEAGSTSRRGPVRLRLDSLYSRGVSVGRFAVERSVDASDHLPLWMDIVWQPAPPNSR